MSRPWPGLGAALLGIAVLGWSGAGTASEEAAPAGGGDVARATFAGGCFWCMEPPFDKLEGVISTTSGYAGGPEENPTYEQVARGQTGHAEVVQVIYDPARISYAELLQVFWRNIDPLAVDRQFCDAGRQYRSAIFYHDEAQRVAAEQSLAEIRARFSEPVATVVAPLQDSFYPAEAYHQDYYMKNPLRYRFYRYNCGRDQRLESLWGQEAGGNNLNK